MLSQDMRDQLQAMLAYHRARQLRAQARIPCVITSEAKRYNVQQFNIHGDFVETLQRILDADREGLITTGEDAELERV